MRLPTVRRRRVLVKAISLAPFRAPRTVERLLCVLVGRQDAEIIATQRTDAHRGRRGPRSATGPIGRLGAEDRAARGASRGCVSGWHGTSAPTAGSRCSGGSSGHRRRGSGGAYRCVRTVQGGTQAGRLRGQHAARRSLLTRSNSPTDRSPSMAASSLTATVTRRSCASLLSSTWCSMMPTTKMISL